MTQSHSEISIPHAAENSARILQFPSGERFDDRLDGVDPSVVALDGIANVLGSADRPFNYLRDEFNNNMSVELELDSSTRLTCRVVFSVPTHSELPQDSEKVDTLLMSSNGDFFFAKAEHGPIPRKRRNLDHSLVMTHHFKGTIWNNTELVKLADEYTPEIKAFLDSPANRHGEGGTFLDHAERDEKRHHLLQQRRD